MRYPGFIGPAYQARSDHSALDTCINLYPELVESGTGRGAATLYLRPGLTEIADVGNGPIRAMHGIGDYLYVVSGADYYEIVFSGGSPGVPTNIGTVGNDGNPAYLAFSSAEQFVVSNGNGFINGSGSFSQISSNFPSGNALGAGILDGYFVTVDSRDFIDGQYARFHISNLNDGLTWDAADFAEFRVDQSRILNFLVTHRELWLFGNRVNQVWVNDPASSTSEFPIIPNESATIEIGCLAPYTPAALDNSVFWIGDNVYGTAGAFRGDGYLPTRVSTHAVEDAWRQYSTVADAISWTTQFNGHMVWVIFFPTADETWCYDVTASRQFNQHIWYQWTHWDSVGSAHEAHFGRTHAFVAEQNVIGSRVDGKIYRMGLDLFDDAGDAIRWERAAPHIHDDERRTFFDRLTVDMETNVGGAGDAPQISMQYTNDSGANWSTARTADIGESDGSPGANRVFWPRLGSSRRRAFRVFGTTTSSKIALTDAYLRLRPGYF